MPKIPKTRSKIIDLRPKKQLEGSTSGKKPAKDWLSFIKYNNAFIIILVIGVIAFTGLAMASDDLRESTLGKKNVYAEGVDNTLLLETDLDNFNMDFKILGITEDEENYLVTYGYIDLDLVNGVWQYVEKEASRRINKPFRRDLGLYLAEELSEEAKARIKELKKLQKQAQEQGKTKIVQVTEYSGLIGKVLDVSAAIFPGYEPVKKIKLETPAVEENIVRRISQKPDNLTNLYHQWIEEHPQEYAELNQEDFSQKISTSTEIEIEEIDGTEDNTAEEETEEVEKKTEEEVSTSTEDEVLEEVNKSEETDDVLDEISDNNNDDNTDNIIEEELLGE